AEITGTTHTTIKVTGNADITNGKLVHDGPLSAIIEKFGAHKQVRLQFAGDTVPVGLWEFGEFEQTGPVAELRLERAEVAGKLAAILDRFTVIDMSVQDPPLEQVIGRVFEEGKAG
ncbi:MAG: hypothetical protein K2W96_06090, partial [Gemmataceae bacterium]|nr:hypothetical protein [Gemmataceae bacterium]